MNLLVDRVKAVPKSILNAANAMQLSVVRTHDRTIVTDELLTGYAEVAQLLLVEHADAFAVHQLIHKHRLLKHVSVGGSVTSRS